MQSLLAAAISSTRRWPQGGVQFAVFHSRTLSGLESGQTPNWSNIDPHHSRSFIDSKPLACNGEVPCLLRIGCPWPICTCWKSSCLGMQISADKSYGLLQIIKSCLKTDRESIVSPKRQTTSYSLLRPFRTSHDSQSS